MRAEFKEIGVHYVEGHIILASIRVLLWVLVVIGNVKMTRDT